MTTSAPAKAEKQVGLTWVPRNPTPTRSIRQPESAPAGSRAVRRITALALATLTSLLLLAPGASASFDLSDLDVTFTDAQGETVVQAGAHPFAMNTVFGFPSEPVGSEGAALIESPKNLTIKQIPGFVGNPTSVPTCTTVDFLTEGTSIAGEKIPNCPDATAVGMTGVKIADPGIVGFIYASVYNLKPPPGRASKLGFWVKGVPVTLDVGVEETPPYRITAYLTNISQLVEVIGGTFTLWGTPADPEHDDLRGRCLNPTTGESDGSCPANVSPVPFLTLPRACDGPLRTTYSTDSWQNPGLFSEGFAETHNSLGDPQGMEGCGKLAFDPSIDAEPTSKAASSPTGLDFGLDTENEGLSNPSGLSSADIDKTIVTLPEGFSANPAIAEGLETCSEAQFEAESAFSAPGEGPTFTPPGAGCPSASKIGSVEVETPVLEDQVLRGSLYIATPYENPFGSLLALYMVIKDPELGIVVKVPLRVEPDPQTGQLTTVAENLPPFPVSHFGLHFREGARSPLVTPSACGTYDGHDAAHEPIRALLYPSTGGAPVETTAAFEIISGPSGGPCPDKGLPPFHPSLVAGTVNNAAGSFSPFNVKLTRTDAEQEFTNFSIKLPPGVAGKLAGIPFCSDAQIALATGRTGPHGGAEELADPSCPAASRVGRTLAGAGVGSSPAYAPGNIYLAGPYHGSPISFVAITAGVVGPFDIGTVVVRLAIEVNPETGEVFLDSTGSDPIPHIVKGIPLHVRDIRAYTDRPEFTFNPTSCAVTSTSATVLGAGLDFASAADDNPFVSTSPFQAADCASLPFKPKLSFKLKGGTRRGANPSLRAHVGMNGFGEAAIRTARVTLPKSEFLEQGHIGTVCTRVQFNAGAVPGEGCPAASIYGKVVAQTPILDGPLAGPIFLRSNGGERDLPDLVAALHGQIDVSLVGFVDSGKNGGIRNTFAFVPDAPVTSADFTFFGGKKSLLSNSRNLCRSVNKVKVELKAHSGKQLTYKTPLKPTGCKKGKKKAKSSARHRR